MAAKKQAIAEFVSFLNNKKCSNNMPITHTSMGDPIKGKFHIDDDHMYDFYRLYKQLFELYTPLAIVERHKNTSSPLLIDLDFKQAVPERIYTTHMVTDFLTKINDIAMKYIDEKLSYAVLEKNKPRPTDDKIFKDGIHIMSSKYNINHKVLHHIRNEFINQYPKFFANLYPTNAIEDIFDKSVISTNGWFMYGSKKPDETNPWLVSSFISFDDDIHIAKIADKHQTGFVEEFSIRCDIFGKKFTDKPECKYTTLGKSIIGENTNTKTKPKTELKTVTVNTLARSDYDVIKEIVPYLNEGRAFIYEEWIQLGLCLRNIENSNRMFEVWNEFSKKCPEKYNENDCKLKWNNMVKDDRGLKLGSLFYWFKLDNPQSYIDIMKKLTFSKDTNANIDEVKMSTIIHEYDIVKRIFEKNAFKIDIPVGYCVEEPDHSVTLYAPSNFRERFRDITAAKTVYDSRGQPETKTFKFINEWLDDGCKRKFSKLDFVPPPAVCPNNVYNLWNGFKIDNIDCESSNNIEPFLKHAAILVNHKEAELNYLMCFLAQLIKEPGHLLGIAIVFVSKEGAGKNVFWNAIGEMIGSQYFFETADPEKEIFSRFSNGRKNKLLINIDETKSKDTFSNADLLKNMITSEVFNYEQKGVDPIVLKNFARFVFTTNNLISVKITNETRRYVVFESSNELVGNQKYFTDLVQYFKDPCNQKAIIEYLRNVDYSNINWIKDRPITETYSAIRSYCSEPIYKFLADVWEKNKTRPNHIVKASKLLEEYTAFLIKEQYATIFIQKQSNKVLFGMELTKIMKNDQCGITKEVSYGRDRCNVYIFDIAKLQIFLVHVGVITEQTYMFMV